MAEAEHLCMRMRGVRNDATDDFMLLLEEYTINKEERTESM